MQKFVCWQQKENPNECLLLFIVLLFPKLKNIQKNQMKQEKEYLIWWEICRELSNSQDKTLMGGIVGEMSVKLWRELWKNAKTDIG